MTREEAIQQLGGSGIDAHFDEYVKECQKAIKKSIDISKDKPYAGHLKYTTISYKANSKGVPELVFDMAPCPTGASDEIIEEYDDEEHLVRNKLKPAIENDYNHRRYIIISDINDIFEKEVDELLKKENGEEDDDTIEDEEYNVETIDIVNGIDYVDTEIGYGYADYPQYETVDTHYVVSNEYEGMDADIEETGWANTSKMIQANADELFGVERDEDGNKTNKFTFIDKLGNGGGLVTADAISGSVIAGLENLKLNSGAAFLEGKMTSAFNMAQADLAAASSLAMQGADDLANAGQFLEDTINNITQQVIQNAVDKYTTDLMNYTMDAIMEVVDPVVITNSVTNMISYYTNVCTKGMSEIMEQFTKAAETRMTDNEKKKSEERKQKSAEKFNNLVTGIKDFVSDAKTGISTGVAYITYARENLINGPDWIIEQCNTYTNMGFEIATSYIDLGVNIVKDYRDGFIDKIAYQGGMSAANAINKTMEKTVKAKVSKAAVTIMKGLTKATTLLMSATQTIAANLGLQIAAAIKMATQKGIDALMGAVTGQIDAAMSKMSDAVAKGAEAANKFVNDNVNGLGLNEASEDLAKLSGNIKKASGKLSEVQQKISWENGMNKLQTVMDTAMTTMKSIG